MKNINRIKYSYIFLFCLLTAFAPFTAFSQSYFKEIATEEDDIFGRNKYLLNDTTLLAVYGKGNFSLVGYPMPIGKYKIQLVAINTSTGEITEKAILPGRIGEHQIDEAYYIHHDAINQRFILTGLGVHDNRLCDEQNTNETQFSNDLASAIVHVDYNYNVIFDTVIMDTELEELRNIHYLTPQSELLITGIFLGDSRSEYLWKTDIYGNVLSEIEYYSQNGLRSTFEILKIDGIEQYLLFRAGIRKFFKINMNTLSVEEEVVVQVENSENLTYSVYGVSYDTINNSLLYVIQAENYDNAFYAAWDTTTVDKPYINAHYIETPQSSYHMKDRVILNLDNNIYMATCSPDDPAIGGVGGISDIPNAVVLQKYNIGGDALWSRTYTSVEAGYHYLADGISYDKEGNIIVFARRFDVDGDIQRDIIYFKVDKETGNMIPWDE